MNIVPLGAAGGEVTGSAYLVQTSDARVLVDCGLFQGGKALEARNQPPAGLQPKTLDAVLLTHGHLDHVGRLPLLAKAGYGGPIFATPATVEMAALILRDSAKIQLQDAERNNRKRLRAGLPPKDPIYLPEHAEAAIALLHAVQYRDPVPLAPGIQALWREAGHMLGSASVQVVATENGQTRRAVFSGDLGPRGAPILRDAEPFREADIVFLESTYGDRDHQPFRETVDEFVRIVHDTVERGGKILVPTFAVGRAQLLTVLLSWMFRERKVKPFPVFLDSPMASEAWKIYSRHTDLFDDEMLAFMREGSMEADLRTMTSTVSATESRALNDQAGPCLIMAGAGMCNAGRIQHHLRQNLWKPETHVVIVGYQGEGTLGRQLVDRAKFVKIHGEKVAVKARVHTLGGFSAHAGQTDLLDWFGAMSTSRPRIAIIHGEDKPRQALAQLLRSRHAIEPLLPAIGEAIDL
jgi:metallo-beta-lactamase family protein